MSVLGYCPLCEQLVTIRPGRFKWGSREREWETQPHEDKEGVLCPNTKRI